MGEYKSQAMRQIQHRLQQEAQMHALEYRPFACADQYELPPKQQSDDSLVSSAGQVQHQQLPFAQRSYKQQELKDDSQFVGTPRDNTATDSSCYASKGNDYVAKMQWDPPTLALESYQKEPKQVQFALQPAEMYLQKQEEQLLDHDTIVKIVTQLKTFKEENTALKAQLQTKQRMSSELVQLNQQLEIEKKMRREAESRSNDALSAVQRLEAQNASCKQQISNLTQYNEKMENGNFTLKGELEVSRQKHQQRIDELLKEQAKEREETKQYITDLETKYADKNAEIERLNCRIKEMKEEQSEAKKEIEQLNEKLAFGAETAKQSQEQRIQEQYALVREFSAIKKQNSALSDELEAQKKENAEMKEQMANVASQNDISKKLQAQFEQAAASDKSQLQTQIEQWKQQFSELSRDKEAGSAKFTQRIAVLEHQNEELAKKLQEAHNQNAQAHDSSLALQIDKLTAIIQAKDAEIERMSRQNVSKAPEGNSLAKRAAEQAIIIETLRQKLKNVRNSEDKALEKQVSELQAENEDLQKRLRLQSDAQKQLLEMQKENVRLSDKVILEQQRVQQLKAERENGCQQLQRAKKQIAAANQALQERQQSDEQRELEARARERSMKERDEALSAAEDQIRALRSQLAARQGLEDKVRLLQNKLIIAENDLKNRMKQNNADTFRLRIHDLEAKINELQADNKSLSKELEQRKSVTARDQNSQNSQFQQGKTAALQELTEKLAAAQAENNQLAFDLEQARIDVQQAQSGQQTRDLIRQINELKKAYDQQRHSLRKENATELEGLRQVILKQQSVIDDLKRAQPRNM